MSTFCSAQNDTTYLKYVIQTLAHDSMQGREVGSLYEKKSIEFLKKEINKKHKTLIQNFSFIHPYSKKKINSKNVYCFINNNSKKTILLSAHYDHLGLGEHKSLALNSKNKIHNGADDNASGVALILSLLNSELLNKKYNYIFMFYSAHELGLYGSKYFEENASKTFKNIHLVLNFDMVGRLDKKENVLTIYGCKNNIKHNEFFLKKRNDIKLNTSDIEKINETDGKYFYQKGINSLSFTTGTHLDYHKPSDDDEYINYNGIVKIKNLLEEFLNQLN